MAVLAGAFVSHIVGITGGSEKMRKVRQDQGILIASGLMAGAAIFGILTAILRQPALGAPIQWISLGEPFLVEYTKAGVPLLKGYPLPWYEGIWGQGISLAMFLALSITCFWLAKKGAEWFLEEEEAAERDNSG
jgi:hypothetical protein